MKNKILLIIILLVIIIVIVTFSLRKNYNGKNSNDKNFVENTPSVKINAFENNIQNEIKESEEIVESTIKIIINNKNYEATLEQNKTTEQFVNMLPQEFNMNELNGNEKYVYLDTALPTNSYNPKHIEAGDIMLYGDNCLVVFYKSFDTSYSYTKIGHIENIEDLGSKNITIKFEK